MAHTQEELDEAGREAEYATAKLIATVADEIRKQADAGETYPSGYAGAVSALAQLVAAWKGAK